MKATDRITEDDYVNAMKLFTRLTPALIVIYSVATVILMAIAWFGPPRIKGGAIGGLAGGLIVTVVGRHIVSPIVARRNYRKYKAIHDEFAVELIDEGLWFSEGSFILPCGNMP